MKWREIEKAYKDQWVLIEVREVDDSFNIIDGDVLASSKDKNEIYQKLLQIKPNEFAIEYTGKIPEDPAIVMVMHKELLFHSSLCARCFSSEAPPEA